MPVIRLTTSATLDDDQRQALRQAFGNLISMVPGKSEQWLMCAIEDGVCMSMAGEAQEPCALVTVDVFARSAVASDVWAALTPRICQLLHETANVDPARTYIKYGWTPDFGWNGMNF